VTLAASDLAPEAVLPLLATRRLGRSYELLSTCGSTSDEVAGRAKAGAQEGLLIAADVQTSGRGRRGRQWHSPPGQNLYCSLLLRPSLDAQRATPITLLAGVALAEALAGFDTSPRLKWPNDVLLDTPDGPRKVAGILVEMATEGTRVRHLILGVGVNVNVRSFPEPLARLATSLCLSGGHTFERPALLASFLNAFEPIYDQFLAHGPGPGLDRWRKLGLLGQACWVSRESGRMEGVASDVDEAGALLLRTANGKTIPVHAGEINWLSPKRGEVR
jgi:BirA family biotin operon repressor/biotin-[acetyl-CoA-carboxylase] ligase